jgi:hypothetical protein
VKDLERSVEFVSGDSRVARIRRFLDRGDKIIEAGPSVPAIAGPAFEPDCVAHRVGEPQGIDAVGGGFLIDGPFVVVPAHRKPPRRADVGAITQALLGT